MTDYISREAAIESVREKVLICESLPDTIAKYASLFTLTSMNDSLNSIPAGDVVEVVRGKWEYVDIVYDGANKISSMRCSNCHKWHNEVFICGNPTDFVNYCSFCGAKMEVEQE